MSETGSGEVRRLLKGGAPLASATIAYPELYSGLTRRHREGALSPFQYWLACRRVERDWMALVKVELGAEVLIAARELIQRHGLRAFDAMHLASALALHTAANEPVTFVAADHRLLRAASSERLATINPETVGHRKRGLSMDPVAMHGRGREKRGHVEAGTGRSVGPLPP